MRSAWRNDIPDETFCFRIPDFTFTVKVRHNHENRFANLMIIIRPALLAFSSKAALPLTIRSIISLWRVNCKRHIGSALFCDTDNRSYPGPVTSQSMWSEYVVRLSAPAPPMCRRFRKLRTLNSDSPPPAPLCSRLLRVLPVIRTTCICAVSLTDEKRSHYRAWERTRDFLSFTLDVSEPGLLALRDEE